MEKHTLNKRKFCNSLSSLYGWSTPRIFNEHNEMINSLGFHQSLGYQMTNDEQIVFNNCYLDEF